MHLKFPRLKIRIESHNNKAQPSHYRARGYKTFFMLNSAEHEILSARKYENIKKSSFSGSDKPRVLFFLLINVKMPTIIVIITFMSRKNSCSAELNMIFL